jgi:hypothetical protein
MVNRGRRVDHEVSMRRKGEMIGKLGEKKVKG